METKNKSKIRLSQSARAGPFLKPLQIIVSALIQNIRAPLHIVIADCCRADRRQAQAADCTKTFKIRILALHNENTSELGDAYCVQTVLFLNMFHYTLILIKINSHFHESC